MEDVSERVRDLPALGEAGLQIEMLVTLEERIEEQHVNALGKAIGTNAGIEVGRAALDDHDQGVAIRAMGAGGREREEQQRDCEARTTWHLHLGHYGIGDGAGISLCDHGICLR